MRFESRVIGERDCSAYCGGFGGRCGLKLQDEVSIRVLHGLK